MSDIQKANMIEFEYLGKHYCLEYTPDSIKQMEASGFSINDISDKPATRIEQLWAGAFLANHRRVSNTVISELFRKMKNRDALLRKLTEMYNGALEYLLPDDDGDDQGNVDWTATL